MLVSADIEFVCCIVIKMKIMTHIGANIRTMVSKCQYKRYYAHAKCQDNEKCDESGREMLVL